MWTLWAAIIFRKFCSGFSTLLINFRGSIGNGDATIRCLTGHIGDYEIKDCYLALSTIKEQERIQDLFLYGGSFGGFIAGHLVGRYTDMFKAMVLRSPLIDMATKTNYADSPTGWVFSFKWVIDYNYKVMYITIRNAIEISSLSWSC